MAKSTPEQLEVRRKDRANWSPEKKAKYCADLKKWRLENPGYSAKALSAWVRANPERWAFLRWKTSIKKNYGLSLEQYQALIKSQNNRCAICGLLSGKILHVDHCHTTKRVRGLLCRRCNTGIGFLNDDPKMLKRAIDYLTK